jgi:hypothetical protein
LGLWQHSALWQEHMVKAVNLVVGEQKKEEEEEGLGNNITFK